MNAAIQISSEPLLSMNDLLLRVVIHDGASKVYDQVVLANDNDAVIRLFDDATSAAGVNVTEMEQQLADHVFKARAWHKAASKQQEAGGFRPAFLTSAALEQLDARHRWLIKHVLVRDGAGVGPSLLGGSNRRRRRRADNPSADLPAVGKMPCAAIGAWST